MNTPTHVVLNSFLLGRGRFARCAWPIAFGALVPDLSILAFYLYQRFWKDLSERAIWSQAYFLPHWQALFDAFHSLPLIALAALVAHQRRSNWLLAGSASMALHVAVDLPLHNEDAHGHFWPLTSWRFRSPLSYWDPNHYGRWIVALEVAATIAACVALWRRGGRWRWIAGITASLYATGIGVAIFWWSRLGA
jgi:hypothetical protein